MRISRFSYLVASAMLLSVSCNKDTAVEDEQQTEIDNPETGKPGTDNPDTDNPVRVAAKKLYADYYLASNYADGDISWTGNLPSCDPGSVPQITRDKIFLRLAYFRKAVGLDNEISENDSKTEKAQKAALMMHANGTLSHDPPSNWECFSDDGKEGAGNSLLTSTRNAGAIDSYIRDQGSDNFPVGHRRWLLWPRLQEIGIGNTSSYNAVWVLGNAGPRPADAPEFIAWPPEGYLPHRMAFARWSFSIDEADFTQTRISMRVKNGDRISLNIEELSGSYGDNTIVWIPEIRPQDLTVDTTYLVTLTDVDVNGESKDFEYEVVLFDPNS